MNKPTAASLRADTRIDWEGLFNIPAGAGGDTILGEEIDLAWAYVEQTTNRDLDTLVDANLVPIASRAVKLRVVQQAEISKGTFADVTAMSSPISSFSVPGYSETRRDMNSQGRQGGQRPYRFNSWAELDDLLWLLATQTAKDTAIAEARGTYTPYFGVAHETEPIPEWGIEEGLDSGGY